MLTALLVNEYGVVVSDVDCVVVANSRNSLLPIPASVFHVRNEH
jgi:hypothetical protein